MWTGFWVQGIIISSGGGTIRHFFLNATCGIGLSGTVETSGVGGSGGQPSCTRPDRRAERRRWR